MLELELRAAGHSAFFDNERENARPFSEHSAKSAEQSQPSEYSKQSDSGISEQRTFEHRASEQRTSEPRTSDKHPKEQQPLRASARQKQLRRVKELRTLPPELPIIKSTPDVTVIDADTHPDAASNAVTDSETERTIIFSTDRKKLEAIAYPTEKNTEVRCFLRPFGIARFIEAVNELCSASKSETPDNVKPSERLAFDLENSRVYFGGTMLELTKREYELLCCLYESRPEPVSRSELIKRVWRYDFEGNTNVVDVYIRYLREKVDIPYGVKLIETVRGAGYRLN